MINIYDTQNERLVLIETKIKQKQRNGDRERGRCTYVYPVGIILLYMTVRTKGRESEPSTRRSPATGTRGFPTTTTGTQVHHLSQQQCRIYIRTRYTRKTKWHHTSNNDTSALKKTKRSPEKGESLKLALDLHIPGHSPPVG